MEAWVRKTRSAWCLAPRRVGKLDSLTNRGEQAWTLSLANINTMFYSVYLQSRSAVGSCSSSSSNRTLSHILLNNIIPNFQAVFQTLCNVLFWLPPAFLIGSTMGVCILASPLVFESLLLRILRLVWNDGRERPFVWDTGEECSLSVSSSSPRGLRQSGFKYLYKILQ